MKKKINKLMVGATTFLLTFLATTPVYASGVNQSELENWVKGYLDPLSSALMVFVPIVFVIYALVKAVQWFKKESEGGQQMPYLSSITNGIIVAIVAMSISTIMKIFSLS